MGLFGGNTVCSLCGEKAGITALKLPEGQLKALVGHSRSMDTYGIYAHPVQGQTQQISTALDQLFSSYG